MVTHREPDVATFLASLSTEQRQVLGTVRDVVRKHLPSGYVERLSGKFINYEIPLERYPKTYNGQPLVYVALAAQKNYFALYLTGAYQDPRVEKNLREGFKDAGKALDMGKSCLRFRSLEDLPLDVVGRVIAHCSVTDFIAQYEASRSAPRKRPTKGRS
jgi:hypothetical protein